MCSDLNRCVLRQVTAQDLSTMIRYKQRSIIFLINNGGYTIEVEIHDGPYNVIKNWSYTKVAEAFHNGDGPLWTIKVHFENPSHRFFKIMLDRTISSWSQYRLLSDIYSTVVCISKPNSLSEKKRGEHCVTMWQVTNEPELGAAVKAAQEKVDMLCFIEVICHKDDTSRELLEWGARVSAANGRPAQPDL